ncbi:MAG TPA: ABC transporter permease [Gemmatimonadales bacterium]
MRKRAALAGLVWKETRHILRDRKTLAVILLMPLLQVILFGYAIRTDIDDVRLAIVDPVPDHATHALRDRFGATELFRIVAVRRSSADLDGLFASGRIHQAVVFQPGFAERLAHDGPAPVQVITDAAEPNTGTAMQAYATAVIREYESGLRGSGPAGAAVTASVRMRFNPTRESANLFVPGLIAYVITIISALMTAISLSREKETGTMEVLLVSPLRPREIIAGKVAPYLLIGMATVILVLAEARLIFGVPLRGSAALLLAEGLLFTGTSLALGILISARTPSQRVAMTAVLAGTMLPTVMLSGFIFPIESLPAPLRLLSVVIPARWFVEIARGIMLKGTGLAELWQETVVLAAMTAALLAASMRSFRTRLE